MPQIPELGPKAHGEWFNTICAVLNVKSPAGFSFSSACLCGCQPFVALRSIEWRDEYSVGEGVFAAAFSAWHACNQLNGICAPVQSKGSHKRKSAFYILVANQKTFSCQKSFFFCCDLFLMGNSIISMRLRPFDLHLIESKTKGKKVTRRFWIWNSAIYMTRIPGKKSVCYPRGKSKVKFRRGLIFCTKYWIFTRTLQREAYLNARKEAEKCAARFIILCTGDTSARKLFPAAMIKCSCDGNAPYLTVPDFFLQPTHK